MLLLADEIGRTPDWVVGLAALVALVLIPAVNALVAKWMEVKKAVREGRTVDEDTAAAHWRALMKSVNDQHGKALARFEQERQQWQREMSEYRQAVNKKLDELEKENRECRESAARQEEEIKWLHSRSRDQDEEIAILRRRLGDLSSEIEDPPGGNKP